MARIAPVNAKGTRDFLPRDLVRRNRVFTLLRETFERYGYEPLETPAIENTSVLEGKYGEEGERLLFRVLKRGRDLESAGRALLGEGEQGLRAGELSRQFADEALRYDLTVPFARVIAAHQNEILLPFRRYQMQPVWRADRPQRGRFREFFQCDVDCVGSRSVTVEAEMLGMANEVFTRLGFTDFIIRINHRQLLAALLESLGVVEEQRTGVFVAIDKLDKIGPDGVRAELEKTGLEPETIDRLLETLALDGTPEELLERLDPVVGASEQGRAALDDLRSLFRALPAMNVPAESFRFDLSLVRGLGYYTGPIFEVISAGAPIGSIAGGGRYDQLIGAFLGRDLPCVGISFGIERIFTAMEILGLQSDVAVTTTQALVTLFSTELAPEAFSLATVLRASGVRTEVYAEPRDIGTQIRFASNKGIPVVCILGPDEIARNEVALRDLRTKEQHAVPREVAVVRVLELLASSEEAQI